MLRTFRQCEPAATNLPQIEVSLFLGRPEETILMSRFEPLRFARAVISALVIAVAALASAQPAAAAAKTPPEKFVEVNVQRGLAILNNHNVPDSKRRSDFRDFLTGLTDIRRIALFTLGPARRTAAVGDVDAFVNAFRDYAVAVYESRLNQYSGQTLNVTGSTEVAAGDNVVTTVLVDPSGKTSGQPPIEVDFRVVGDGGKFVVVDASIAGVWLGQEERDQFTSFLQQNNNNLRALSQHLQVLAAQLRNGGH
jgi:phospholipid transport system substrate-binding protein